jgi:hypothetical protein
MNEAQMLQVEMAKVRAIVIRYGGTAAQAALVTEERCRHLVGERAARARRERDAAELRAKPEPADGAALLLLHIDRHDARDWARMAIMRHARERMTTAREILVRYDADGVFIDQMALHLRRTSV